MQPAIEVASTQSMKSRLPSTVLQVIRKKQRRIQKNLLHFGLGNTMPLILPGVAFIPVKPDVGHGRPLYMPAIYHELGIEASEIATAVLALVAIRV
jgi:hypothetical protein